MSILIYGTGYVGLCSGISLLLKGNDVVFYDLDKKKINLINDGKSPFYEKNLLQKLEKLKLRKKIYATFDEIDALKKCSVIFVSVGTPSKKNGQINLEYIKNAISSIGSYININNEYKEIVIRSTVLPSTTDTFVRNILIKKIKNKKLFGLSMIPEFLQEGHAVKNSLNPDRIVIGTDSSKSKKNLKKIFDKSNCKVIYCNTRTAELTKYVNNFFLSNLISSINEISNLSYNLNNIDLDTVLKGMFYDRRWKNNFKKQNPDIINYIKPGPGFGGSCFTKDLKALSFLMKSRKIDNKIISSVTKVNDKQFIRINNFVDKKLLSKSKVNILIMGLAFKQDTDDVRNSTSINVIKKFNKKKKYNLYLFDKLALINFRKIFNKKKRINYLPEIKDLKSYKVIIIMNRSKEYEQILLNNIKELANIEYIIDTRSLIKSKKITKLNSYIKLF